MLVEMVALLALLAFLSGVLVGRWTRGGRKGSGERVRQGRRWPWILGSFDVEPSGDRKAQGR